MASYVTPSPATPFDLVILTAANEVQAQGYRAQLADRVRQGSLPPQTGWLVVPDPGGRRVGSGCGTLEVLREIAASRKGRTLLERFEGLRVLIAHSGGDSRRLPAYAAQGKVFLPLPCDIASSGTDSPPRPAALFDLLVESLSHVPHSPEGEIIVCSGDVLLTYPAASVALNVRGGIGGLGFAVAPAEGRNHGVYITANPTVGGIVREFLQKPDIETLIDRRAVDSTGRVLVDTGVFAFSPAAAVGLMEAAGLDRLRAAPRADGLFQAVLDGRVGSVDLYLEIALALPGTAMRSQYLENVAPENQTPEAQVVLGRFFDRIHALQLPFSVAAVPDGEFLHIGTSRDLLSKVTAPSRAGLQAGFHNGHRVFDPSAAGSALTLEWQRLTQRLDLTLQNVTGHPRSLDPHGSAYLEACDVNNSIIRLDGENVLVGWKGGRALHLPRGLGLVVLPVSTEAGTVEVPVLFGVDDDNKTRAERGGLWLNRPWDQWIEAGLCPADIWPESAIRSSWTARVWRGGQAGWDMVIRLAGSPSEAIAALRAKSEIPDGAVSDGSLPDGSLPDGSLPGQSFSWEQLIARIDHTALLAWRENLATHYDAQNFFHALLSDPDFPVQQRLNRLPLEAGWLENFQEQLTSAVEQIGLLPLHRARLERAGAVVKLARGDEEGAKALDRAALDSVRATMESGVLLPHKPRKAGILRDQAVWATAPARIDFAGGWSDTPPICLDRGGAVLNGAVTLNGQYPNQAVAKLNDDYVIRITSVDLGQQEVYTEASEINGPLNLRHWSSLAKAALVLTGIVPESNQKSSLKEWLQVLGGGINLTLFSGLPKGSGLGTSSILGAATIACLNRVRGLELTHADLMAQTSLLEQRLTSGGGWQDQVGGIVAGVKLIKSRPGLDQTPQLQWTVFGPTNEASAGLRRRMLLYFTGQERLAANILQHVVGRYLAREPEVLRIVDRLKNGAEEAKAALEANDIAAFAARVDEYWELKKGLDPGSTNDNIEAILERVKRYTSARLVCGAGGGGFMLLIARDAEAADRIRLRLDDNPIHHRARFFDFAIDTQGLKVTVL